MPTETVEHTGCVETIRGLLGALEGWQKLADNALGELG